MFDAHANLAISTVAAPPSPFLSGTTLTVTTGDGSLFPAPPFNATVWPGGTTPTSQNAEIVRVTAIATDSFTFVRAQENTTAVAIRTGYLIANTVTAGDLTTIETALTSGSGLPAAVALTSAAQGTVYVATTGNDSNSGLSWGQAFLTVAAAVAAMPSGGTIEIGQGTFTPAPGMAPAANTVIRGRGPGRTILQQAANSVLIHLNALRVTISDLELRLTSAATTGTLVSFDGCFHCVLDNVWVSGQHTAIGDAYQSQVGLLFKNNAGDNMISRFVIANLGMAVDIASATNYFNNGTFGYNYRAIVAGSDSPTNAGGGASFNNVTWNGSNTACDHHMLARGSSNSWTFAGCWWESALVDVEIGDASGGAFNVTMTGILNMAATNQCLVLGAANTASLLGIEFGFDPPEATIGSLLSTGGPITALPVSAMPVPVNSGQSINVVSGGHSQTFVASGTTAVGATSIPITSATPNFAYPTSATVTVWPIEITINATHAPAGMATGINSAQFFDFSSVFPKTWTWASKTALWVPAINLGSFGNVFTMNAAAQSLFNPGGQTNISPGSTDITVAATPRTSGSKVMQLRGASGQTANLLETTTDIGGVLAVIDGNGLIKPVQAATGSAPTYVKGGMYFDTTLNALRVGGATVWETVSEASCAFNISSSGLTLSNSGLAKLAVATVNFDTQAWWDAGNHRWTPQKAGYYRVDAYWTAATSSGGEVLDIGVYKNGTTAPGYSPARSSPFATTGPQFGHSVLVFLNGSTDYVEVWAQSNVASQSGTACLAGSFAGT